jgi:hypothetical protein
MPWCGNVVEADRPPVVAGYPIRVVYATAADTVDRGNEVAPSIAADIEEIRAWWLREDSSRTPRFDLAAAPCGSIPDIVRLRVPRSAGELADTVVAVDAVWDALVTWPLPGYTKYLVYYDGPVGGDVCGRGGGQRSGFGIAVIFVQACKDVATAPTAVHELLHSFGALQNPAAPGACPADTWHVCDSTGDILFPHAQYAPLASFQLDVGRNDYYGQGGALDVQQSFWLHRLDVSPTLELRLRGGGRVTSDVPGIDCSSSCTTQWSPGTRMELTATPAPGNRFVRWEGGCIYRGSNRCDYAIGSSAVMTVLFAPERLRVGVSVRGRGRVTSQPYGLSCPRRCTVRFTSYEAVFLEATPAKGWRFSSWTGACRGKSTTCYLDLTRAAQARATFVRAR